MGFFARIRNSFKAAVKGWKTNNSDFSKWFGKTFFGIENHKLETNELIFSVISRLANTVSSLPLHLYQNYGEINNEISDLLETQPNSSMSAYDLINKVEVSRNENGNGYILIERDQYMAPIALWPIPPQYVTAKINADDNMLWYEITGDTNNLYVTNMDLIHVKHITGPNRIMGISPLKVLKNALDFDGAVQKFSLNEMSKTDSFILEYGASVDEEKRQEVIDNFRQFRNENGGVLFQEPGVKIDKLQRDFVSSDVSNTESITKNRIANAFNIPVSFLNDLSGSSYSSNEQLMTQFVQMTLTPIIKQYETEFNRKLLTQQQRANGFYFKFNLNALMRGDTQARTAFYQMMIRNGIATPNDLRKLEDMPPNADKHADSLYISGDLYPIDIDPAQRKGVTTSANKQEPTEVPDNSETGSK